MISFLRVFILSLTFAAVGCSSQTAVQNVSAPIHETVPLIHAHAHNDYLHQHPLYDALRHGFTSIEADIHLVNNELYVAHDRVNIQSERTLRSLYLNPLQQIVRSSPGWVYGDSTQITLLIDIKSEAEPTYRRLHKLLAGYSSMLTRFEDEQRYNNAVVVIVSGNRPFEYMQSQSERYAAYDGRLADLDKGYDPALVPLISDRWSSHFDWRGEGVIPVEEELRLSKIVTLAHENGQRVRFWATPDYPSPEREQLWNTLLRNGVDLINTDDLRGLQSFLLEKLQQE